MILFHVLPRHNRHLTCTRGAACKHTTAPAGNQNGLEGKCDP